MRFALRIRSLTHLYIFPSLLERTYGIEKYGQEIQFLREIHILSNIFKINLVVAKSCKQKPTEM